MSGKKFPWSKRDDAAASGVYAGPDFFGIRSPMNDVYAGPEFEDDPVDEPEQVDEPTENAAEPVVDKDGAVTPDPAAFNEDDAPLAPPPDLPQPPPEMFMTVYAGPEFWSNNGHPVGAFAPPPESEKPAKRSLEDGEIYCPNCGLPVFKGKFCSECGAILPVDDTLICPSCKKTVHKGKYCSECGALLPQDAPADRPQNI